MEKKTLAIKNISNHEIGIVVPEIRLSRFIQPNRSIKMNKEQLEEALTYPGVPELFNSQYLVCEDDEAMEEIAGGYVNLPATDEERMSEEDIIKLIQTGSDLQFDKLLKSSSPYRLDTIISAALKCESLTFSKINLLKAATGKDILEMKKHLDNNKA